MNFFHEDTKAQSIEKKEENKFYKKSKETQFLIVVFLSYIIVVSLRLCGRIYAITV